MIECLAVLFTFPSKCCTVLCGTCCKLPLTSVCNIINQPIPQNQSEIMSRSYVNLADVTTKCLLNGETQVFVCVIELKYGSCPAFGKLGKKNSIASSGMWLQTSFTSVPNTSAEQLGTRTHRTTTAQPVQKSFRNWGPRGTKAINCVWS